jgi:hypothetical protein
MKSRCVPSLPLLFRQHGKDSALHSCFVPCRIHRLFLTYQAYVSSRLRTFDVVRACTTACEQEPVRLISHRLKNVGHELGVPVIAVFTYLPAFQLENWGGNRENSWMPDSASAWDKMPLSNQKGEVKVLCRLKMPVKVRCRARTPPRRPYRFLGIPWPCLLDPVCICLSAAGFTGHQRDLLHLAFTIDRTARSIVAMGYSGA